jgi:DNA-binding transcriptional MerR regulator
MKHVNFEKLWSNIIYLPVASAKPLAESLNLTYRQLNNWDALGALPCQRRSSPHGWRYFSTADILLLNISLELRTLGLSLGTISKINKFIIANQLLENAFARAVNLGKKVCLWVGVDGKAVMLSCDDAADIIKSASKDSRARILLPITDKVRELAEAAGWSFEDKSPTKN